MKKYNEFTEEEQEDIKSVNSSWFYAEMSDDYNVTRREQKECLDWFNQKYGYNFHRFCMDTTGHIENTWFD